MSSDQAAILSEQFSAHAPLVLVGAGNMGGALAKGWLAAGLQPDALIILDPRDELDPAFAQARHIRNATDLPGDLTARATVLAVKPQLMQPVLDDVAPALTSPGVVISVAAGVLLDQFSSAWPANSGARFVRVMPNTPSAIGRGASGMYGRDLSDTERAVVDALMDVSGLAVWVEDEELLHAVTGVSGSGPAYVFHMVEALAKAGETAGLAPDVAMALARQTVCGAGALMDAVDDSATTLRENVTSPNGTTAAGLSVLMADDGLPPLMERVVAAAAARSRELGQKD